MYALCTLKRPALYQKAAAEVEAKLGTALLIRSFQSCSLSVGQLVYLELLWITDRVECPVDAKLNASTCPLT